MNNILPLIGRTKPLLEEDINKKEDKLSIIVKKVDF